MSRPDGGTRRRTANRWVALIVGGLLASLVVPGLAFAAAPTGAPAPVPATVAVGTRATDVGTVAAGLATDPLYVSTAPGTPAVVAGDVRGALPPDVYVAVLPASASAQVGGEVAALPGAILGRLSRPGTVLVLAGRELEGASRTQRVDRLQQVLTDARNQLNAGGSPAQALVLAARGLTGSGLLSDPPSASRAGSPNGGGFLYVVLGLVLAAVLAVPILLRRARRPAPEAQPRLLRDRVEVDAYGHVVRRLTAKELADRQERPNGS